MPLATPEQLAIFRNRRFRALLVELGASLFAPVPAVAVLLSLGEDSTVARIASAITFLVVALSGQVLRRVWFHCPACNGPFRVAHNMSRSAKKRSPRAASAGHAFAFEAPMARLSCASRARASAQLKFRHVSWLPPHPLSEQP